jgi:hypothetical protein
MSEHHVRISRSSRADYNRLGQLLEAVEGTDLSTALRGRINERLGLEVTAGDYGGIARNARHAAARRRHRCWIVPMANA